MSSISSTEYKDRELNFTYYQGVPVNRYCYCVNTFDHSGYPIQVNGYVEAESELDAIQKVKDSGKIDVCCYEFLDLYVDNDIKGG